MSTMPECLHGSWGCSHGWHTCNDCGLGLGSRTSESITAGHRPKDCTICDQEALTVRDIETYITKDSGKREEYDSGMVRDTQENKPRFDLLYPRGVPYEHQFLSRVASLLARGAEKYEDRNWEKANGQQELDRFQSSAHRHLAQWIAGERDEDHAAAVVFNLLAYESIKWKMENG